MNQDQLSSVRRVVTGLNASGQSHAQFDTFMDGVKSIPDLPGFRWIDLWSSDKTPASFATDDMAEDCPIFPEAEGSVFRVFEIDPDETALAQAYKSAETHPLMNANKTLDFIYVMSGEITVVFDGGETNLREGDFFVQQGTRHAFSNRGNASCRMLAVLVGGTVAPAK